MSRKSWIGLILLSVLVVLLFGAALFIPLVGRGYGLGTGMMGGTAMMGRGFVFGFPFLGGIGMLLFWLLIIAGVVWLVGSWSRSSTPTNTIAPASESPLDILKRRYAKGEINKEQFDEMKQTLGV